MLSYILKRLGLMVPTLLGILTINFFIVQMAPGGPVEQFLAKLDGTQSVYMERVGTSLGDFTGSLSSQEAPRFGNARGAAPEIVAELNRLYGFDKPIGERYVSMIKNYLTFHFGTSSFKADTVLGLIAKALPVSISLGLWSTLIIYAVSIPLGILRARRRNSAFDAVTGAAVVAASAVPGFLFAVILVIFFAGGSYFQIFPLRGLHSANWLDGGFVHAVLDYLWHMALPVASLTIGGFAGLTLLTRNSFLDELGKQYVELARAKGLPERTVLFSHVFRNAMLIVIAGLPGTFVRIFFTGSLLIETIFSLDGLGLLSFEATMQRDYPVMFATLYIFTLVGLITKLLGDITMTLVDPRISFKDQRSLR